MFLTSAFLLSQNAFAAVPHPYYYHRVRRRVSVLTSFGIALGCVLALLAVIYVIEFAIL
jgi:hypothetical protein